MTRAHIVQLPFPSTKDSDPKLSAYYRDYANRFQELIPAYFTPQDSLWEMPLWVAHITSLLDEVDLDSSFIDLSRTVAESSVCAQRLLAATEPEDLILISPLAQNFSVALKVARLMEAEGRNMVIGGNMAPLISGETVHMIHRGQLDIEFARKLVKRTRAGGMLERNSTLGLSPERITWTPDYRHLSDYHGKVPLLRLNASHGCLYDCTFCGDAWSSQLVMVDRESLAREVDSLTKMFPDTRLFYIGDKTFGQSREAVRNLIAVFRDRPGYQFIVQTHVMYVRDWVIDAMLELGVVAVELGFESADSQMLKRLNKLSRGLADYTEKIHTISRAGLKVILNVMGGLDEETEESHAQTIRWLDSAGENLWLFNLYNFVPYPLVPDFARLRSRIIDWDFSHWREDLPVVYRPSHLTRERSWELFQEKISAAHRIIQPQQPRAEAQ